MVQESTGEDARAGLDIEREAPQAVSRPWIKPALLVTALVAMLGAAKVFGVGALLDELRTWIVDLGAWGPVVFIAIYAIAVVAAVPASVLTLAAGAMFGSVLGVATVSIASTLGAALAFAVSRWFARESVARWLSKNERFTALDRMTAEHGAIVVAITRLVPIFPFTLLNYGFGLTGVRFQTYVLWSWVCMLPGTVLYVVGADAVTRSLAEGQVPWMLVGIVVAMAIGLTLIVRRVRGSLQNRDHDQISEQGAPYERAA
ncbi:MAG: TVP38/TMEM64 family protein [bacterium]|nr:TVP38/TMEM64 family protein [bacterium]